MHIPRPVFRGLCNNMGAWRGSPYPHLSGPAEPVPLTLISWRLMVYPCNKCCFRMEVAQILKRVPVWLFTQYPTEIMTSRLYRVTLFLWVLPGIAPWIVVVKKSLTTTSFINSPSLNIFPMWREMFCFVVENNSLICCWVSHTVSPSTKQIADILHIYAVNCPL